MEGILFWTLPGPAGFVGRVAERLLGSDRGLMGVSAPSRRPEGFVSALADSIRNGGGGRVFEVDATDNGFSRSIVHGLARSAGSSRQAVSSVADLVAAPELAAGTFLIDNILSEDWPRWAAFLRSFAAEFQREKSQLAPAVVAILPPEIVGPDLGHIFGRNHHTVWRSCISALDTRLFVSSRTDTGGSEPLVDRVAHEVVVALSGWDLTLAERLCRHDPATLLTPVSLLERVDPSPASWGAGNTDEWDGMPFVSSELCLANADRDAVDRRIWAAYARVLTPFVGDVMSHFVKIYGARLAGSLPYVYDNGAHRRVISTAAELEIGPIYHFLKEVIPHAEASFLKGVVYVRNRIAHHRLPEADAIIRLSDAWEGIRYAPGAGNGWNWPRCGQEVLLTDCLSGSEDTDTVIRAVGRSMAAGETASADVSGWSRESLSALLGTIPTDFTVRLNGEPLTAR